MKQHKSEHYIFNFNEGSKAEIDIEAISSMQEDAISTSAKS